MTLSQREELSKHVPGLVEELGGEVVKILFLLDLRVLMAEKNLLSMMLLLLLHMRQIKSLCVVEKSEV